MAWNFYRTKLGSESPASTQLQDGGMVHKLIHQCVNKALFSQSLAADLTEKSPEEWRVSDGR